MTRIILQRTYTDNGNGPTIGILRPENESRDICEMLERPRFFEGKENVRDDRKTPINESCCIPEGTYDVLWTYSPHFKKYLYQVMGVNSRDGIRIHTANWIKELLGCLAPCLKILKDKKGVYYGSESVKGLEALYKYVGSDSGVPRPFRLTIISDEGCKV
jgi:hypothetical protein